jgi:outer membrane protein assembly factor BamB
MSAPTTEVAAAKPIEPKPSLSPPRTPRLWPAMVIVLAYWIGWVAVTYALGNPFGQFMYYFYGPMVMLLGMLIWWLGFSRQTWLDTLWGIGCIVVLGIAATPLAHHSMWMGMLMYALPVALTVAVVWLVVTRGTSTWLARGGLAAVCLLSWGYYTLLRVDGINGDFAAEKNWRWSHTAEQEYLLQLTNVSTGTSAPEAAAPGGDAAPTIEPAEAAPPGDLIATERDWPGFRGAKRDGKLTGVKLDRDWQAHPPKELWRRRVGPGWSSFAVIGDRAFTQEQRGDQEAVVAFDVKTGREIWAHLDKTRFEEVVAGAGPRGTPTFDQGKLYTLGGSGRLNCLDAATGNVAWTRDMAADAGAKPPMWGFSGSPLVADGVVTVFAGGADGKGVMGYDAQSGKLKWSGGKAKHSYSSTQLASWSGEDQVLLVSDFGLESFDPATGKLLWEHEWIQQEMFRVVQPLILGDLVLIGTGMGIGTRALKVEGGGESWQANEAWTSKELKPYFNDCVEHEENAYGLDGPIMVCIDLETGKKRWKKGRYGHGQVLLVADSGLLVLVTEDSGEVVLVEANPERHIELGRFKALSGKTWNHPVISGDKLLVRNGEEMACFKLKLAD